MPYKFLSKYPSHSVLDPQTGKTIAQFQPVEFKHPNDAHGAFETSDREIAKLLDGLAKSGHGFTLAAGCENPCEPEPAPVKPEALEPDKKADAKEAKASK